jgi:membrane fusion protein (multidrug efflux system)
MAGVVTRRAITPGELAAPGVPLFVVAQTGSVYVTLDLSETDLGQVRSGQPVALRVDAYPGRIFEGVVREVAPAGDPRTRTFKVKVVVPNADRALRPGMFARGEITVGRVVNALVIPRDAVSTDSGQPTVFVVVDGIARSRTVAIGPTYGPVVEIRGGLALGDSVIVSGQSGLTDGTAVTIR